MQHWFSAHRFLLEIQNEAGTLPNWTKLNYYTIAARLFWGAFFLRNSARESIFSSYFGFESSFRKTLANNDFDRILYDYRINTLSSCVYIDENCKHLHCNIHCQIKWANFLFHFRCIHFVEITFCHWIDNDTRTINSWTYRRRHTAMATDKILRNLSQSFNDSCELCSSFCYYQMNSIHSLR